MGPTGDIHRLNTLYGAFRQPKPSTKVGAISCIGHVKNAAGASVLRLEPYR